VRLNAILTLMPDRSLDLKSGFGLGELD